MDQFPRLGKRELICLLLFTCNYVVSVWRGFLFLWVHGMGYVILLWHSLSLSFNYSEEKMKYFGIFRLISVFETTAMLKFSNIQYFPLAPFARFKGSLMRL